MKALIALVLVMIAGLFFGTKVFREHRELTAELAALQAAHPPATASQPDSVSDLGAMIESESALRRAAEAKAVEIGKELPPMSDEEWRSLGRVEELGQQAADFLRTFAERVAKIKQAAPKPDATNTDSLQQTPGGETVAEDTDLAFMQQMMTWLKRMDAIGEMEDDPAEVARLHTATLSTRMKLDASTQARVQQQMEREFTQLHAQKLTRPQRPDTERDAWYLRRRTALNEAAQRIEALIPTVERQEFAVGQSLHLGTGMRTKSEVRPDGHGSVTMAFDLPGIDWKF